MTRYLLVCPHRHDKAYWDSDNRYNTILCDVCNEPLELYERVNESPIITLLSMLLFLPLLGIGLILYWICGGEDVRFWE